MKASFEKLCEDSVVFFTLQTYCRLTETDSSRDGGGGGGGEQSGPERTAEIQHIVVSHRVVIKRQRPGISPGY